MQHSDHQRYTHVTVCVGSSKGRIDGRLEVTTHVVTAAKIVAAATAKVALILSVVVALIVLSRMLASVPGFVAII